MKKTLIFFSCLLIQSISTLSFGQSSPGYKVNERILLEGDGGWDYLSVDEDNSRLFISHGTMVQVLDLKEKKLLATIPDTKGVHGITLAYDLKKGFISNGKDSSVTVFNLKTLASTGKIKITGKNPDALLYDKFSGKVFVYNGASDNATVIDAKSEKVIETIPLAGKPEFSVTDGKGKIFVNIEDKNAVTVINSSTMKVENVWPIGEGEEPTGLALDNKTHRLFIVCGNKLMVIMDALSGKVITTLPIGDHCDGVAFAEKLNCAYSSNGEGTITIVKEENENSFKVTGTLTTQKGARTIALDQKTHALYLPTAEYLPAPEKTAENQRPRPSVKPGTFGIIEVQYIK